MSRAENLHKTIISPGVWQELVDAGFLRDGELDEAALEKLARQTEPGDSDEP